MPATPDAPDLCARTCAKTGCAQTDTANTALQLEASRRECADLKEAYSKMAASLWRAEQVIEHLEGEVAELKAGHHQPPPPQPPQRKRKSSASAATTPASSPAASPAGSATSGKPDKPKRERVPKELASLPAKFEGVPFFDHFGITDSRELQLKLAAFLIAKDHDINTNEKRRVALNQCKFKADNFVTLLWFKAPGDPLPYEPGDVDGFFAFFDRHRGHDDMGKRRIYHNHDHRIGTWLWPSKVSDYASFQHESNKYIARQARGFMTGVRAVHGLYEIFKGNTKWPAADGLYEINDAASSKKRKVCADDEVDDAEEGC